MHRVIGERSLGETGVDPELARRLLRGIVRARVFDERAVALQRRGWMSGYPPFVGQEGSQVGAAHALTDDDWLFPTYRSNAMQLARGRSPADILRFRRGYSEYEPVAEADTETGRGPVTFTQATPIATQLPHAVGAGMAARHRDDDPAVCACFGDGATSEGDFHEAMNVAGVFSAPVVFFCENNGWAISVPTERQTASETIAGKANAYGFEGVRVDGNDPVAVYEVVAEARASALSGDPVLVESLTYRRGPHTTADDPDRYRDAATEDLPDWRTADPLERYADYLREEGVVEAGFVDAAREAATTEVAEAVAAAEESEPDPGDVFDHAYAALPRRVRDQRRGTVQRAATDRAVTESETQGRERSSE
ncbi:branched-chain amino acid dehydrogenase E1 component alpha subunit [Halosimplex carlsbadense 2-9-1]|uniref:Branched-chain amino acid dehydrogenase E1 component alpha subunit n=1 Tax=Halosimplex carlsbadense 2-9-1 TaxID=797114 RepID=M0D6G8_9EURY|nr:thiamine pyrophosphate-dependent enzyme [Halosimplex carlsbadense]ELZ30292.1 branched-chain amino acid dehydrogenase E1 component alpha subunit [Halosimplex carlsbadense 2-9-1]